MTMKIIVCIKQICHTYARTGQNPESRYFNPEDAIYRINPYDEAALELALRFRDQTGPADIILLTLSPLIAESELRRCLAAGADQLCQIVLSGIVTENDPLLQPDPWTKADSLARAVTELGGGLVLCGKESLDRGSGQVGALLAHILKMPYVSAITDLSAGIAADHVRVQRSAGRGVREVIRCPLPAVLSADMGADLRLPVFARRQWALSYSVQNLTYPVIKRPAQAVTARLSPPRPRPKIVPVPDSRLPAYDRVSQLLAGSKVEKKGELLTGSPESQVDGIINYLKANGFLELHND
jgi:electron transfer flavoprotein beta subunit